MIHAFGDCELDEELFQLRRRGKVVRVEPKVFDVLAYLCRHRDHVVTKDELLEAVWPDQVVSESVLPKCVAAARRAIGDGGGRKMIATVHGRGYRFAAAVRSRQGGEEEGTPDGEAAADGEEGSAPPFVGRTGALERLRSALGNARAGRGRVLLLVGEPGIGKTRTAEAFAAEARRGGAGVLFGRAYEGEGAPPFWPWVEILRAHVLTADPRLLAAEAGAGAADVAELVPELRERVRALPPALAVGGEAARFRVFDSVTSFLKRAAARRPFVLVLDDLHWADEGSLRLLRFLAGAVRDSHLLVVATYRDIDVRRGSPLTELLPALARESACERVALRGFDQHDCETFIAAIAGNAPPAGFAAAVQEMTEGNPFFIQEIVRLLLGEGGLPDVAEAERLSLVLPQSVRDAVGRRLNGLTPECNELLRIASVLGREFTAALLARVAERPTEHVLERLAEAVVSRVIDESADGLGRHVFHHALIRQTLYEELNGPERVRLHRRAGEAIEQACGADPEPYADELAHHFFQAASAGDVTRAVDSCVRAAERAARRLAYEQSAAHYERAVQAYSLQVPRDEARRAELLLALGEARSAAGKRDDARAAFESAAEIARRLERVDLLARAAIGYRGPAEMGIPPENTTLSLLQEALATVGDGHPGLRARLLSRLVGTPPYANSMETRDALSLEALTLARRAGDAHSLRDALSARLWASLGPDRIDLRKVVARELLEQSERQQSKHMALLGYEGLIGAHLLRGEMADADRALSGYVRVAEELREPAYLFIALFCQGSRAVARGDFDDGERLFRAALERGRGVVPNAHFMYAGQMYPLTYLRGGDNDPELDRIFFGEMMQLPYSWEPAVRAALAFALFLRGDPEAARREFDALATRGFEALPRDEHWLVMLGTLSRTAVLLEDRPRAALLYDLLSPYSDLVFVHDLLRSIGTSVASALGGLASLLERFDEGAAHFERAIALETAMGNVTAVHESKSWYARLLLTRARAGDRDRAEGLLAEVRADMRSRGISRNWQIVVPEAMR